LDREERIIAVLVGRPDDPQWSDAIDAAAEVMQEVERQGGSMDLFADKCLHHRRGEFLAIPAGVSFGGGQMVQTWHMLFNLLLMSFTLQAPGNLAHTPAMRQLIRRILQSHSIKRIAGFQSSTYLCTCFQPCY
jgi:hypothetical protein